MTAEIGTEWHKWDLHVHTPASFVHDYGGGEDGWEKYIAALEALPPEIAAIGINDYIFLDGYRRVLQFKNSGRLQNLKLILPVIEVRLDKFGGSKNALSRVNWHIIFSDQLSPDVIETQFINALARSYVLTPEYDHLKGRWQALPTRQSLEDLGKLIIQSVPEGERSKFGQPLHEGFNNLNFSQETIQAALQSHYFEGKFLCAVGKTEWADIKWNDQSIADKKSIINSADIVFVAAESPKACIQAREHLKVSNVNCRLLDCSDAHKYADASHKDRLGHCYTWINAELSFRGLRHALLEYPSRVFMGDTPPKVLHVRTNKTKYISTISIRRVAGSQLKEHWFDTAIQVNPGLVAIIGNKGSGKSALADSVALAGNTRHEADFSFLNGKRFRHPKDNKAEHFEAELVWVDGTSTRRRLDQAVPDGAVELVKYLPQSLLEKICNVGPDGRAAEFEQQLKAAIYSHVPDADRLGHGTLDELVASQSTETTAMIAQLRVELSRLNGLIAQLEADSRPERVVALNEQLKARKQELVALDGAKPSAPTAETGQTTPGIVAAQEQLAIVKDQLALLETEKARLEKQLKEATARVALADRALKAVEVLRRQHMAFAEDWAKIFAPLGVPVEDIIGLSIDTSKLEQIVAVDSQQIKTSREGLDPSLEMSTAARIAEASASLSVLTEKFGEPARRAREYETALASWTQARNQVIGDANSPGTISYLESLIAAVNKIPEQIVENTKARDIKAHEIFLQIERTRESYRQLYKPVQDFIQSHPLAAQLGLKFTAEIVQTGFAAGFFDVVSKAASGSFRGEEGAEAVALMLQKAWFGDWSGTSTFIVDILDRLHNDRRPGKGASANPGAQLKAGKSVAGLYDFITGLSYLEPRYSLQFGDRDVAQISPGERGALLLVFYFLVDKGEIPLVVDQPEENLDNQTVYSVLVPAIQEARLRRQVVLVTHNPNLAVACDADQIVFCTMEKSGDRKVRYLSGAIENSDINKHLVDVLEGTEPAFQNRDSKYRLAALGPK